MTLVQFLVLLFVAAVCGAIGQSLAGYSLGGCLVSLECRGFEQQQRPRLPRVSRPLLCVALAAGPRLLINLR